MSVTFDPSRTPVSIPISAPRPCRFCLRGIADTPSSVNRMPARASEGGFCSWLTRLFNKICGFFGFRTASASPSNSAAIALEKRIEEGKRIIDNHFQTDFIRNANAPHSGIVVVMKYNGHHRVSMGTADTQRNSTDVLKAQLRELLTREAQVGDGELRMETMLFERHPVVSGHFKFAQVDSWKIFGTGRSGGGDGNSGCIGQTGVRLQLERAVPAETDRQQIADFLFNRL
jgi:hypothetical protein